MSLIVAQNLSLAFGDRKLFSNVSFRIAQGERIGLIGPNGSGKTSLLRLLAGEYKTEEGALQISKNCQIGYLPQDILELSGSTLLKSIMDSVPSRTKLLMQHQKIIHELERSSDSSLQINLSQQLADTQQKIDHIELHFSEHEALKILFGLGFTEKDLDRQLIEFSGGWKMRIALATLLFCKPEVLLLDEPTNHLDVPSVVWFDDFLRQYQGAAVLVSHDRFFLNRQINRIISFEPEGLRFYSGNYDEYLLIRSREEELLEARAKNIEKERRDLERFVERFKSKATKARQAQSRVKMIARLEKKAPSFINTKRKLHFTFPPVSRAGSEVIKIKKLSKHFDSIHLFKGLTANVNRKDRLAIIGKNGIGKTTLLKLIAGELTQEEGSIELGHNVELRYYAQHHGESLNLNNSILDEIYQEVPTATQTYVRSILGSFLFPGDDVEKPISVLSGGEKSRVALAKLLVKSGNLLLMDEPTNHLDVDSSEALAAALKSFEGTLVFVSHNRSFVNHLATRVWNITSDGFEDYYGNLEEYLNYKAQKEELLQKKKTLVIPIKKQPNSISDNNFSSKKPKAIWEKERAERRAKDREAKLVIKKFSSLKKQTRKLELEIENKEKKIKDIEVLLADTNLYNNDTQFNKLMNDYSTLKSRLEYLYSSWEETNLKLEKIKTRLGNTDSN